MFVVSNKSASQTIRSGNANGLASTSNSIHGPLDSVSSSQIALQAAQMTNLPELTAVRNQTDSENAQLAIAASDTSTVAKPQIVGTGQKSKKDIVHYTTVAGDSITSVAAKFNLNPNSIRWSNNLTGDAVAAGKDLLIPPADGIVYQVKSTDTIDGIVNRYQADKATFITVNDAESGLVNGDYVWVPGGTVAAPVARVSVASTGGFAWGYSPIYSSNGYDYGYCTWWAALRRSQIGRPVPANLGNAITWKSLAARAGFGVGTKPAVGAVIWTPVSYGYGHVGFVEKVNDDGSVWVSDMNSHGYASMSTTSGSAGGWGRVSYRLLSPGEASTFWYIY
jgi:surface antigen/LysM repeat protein